MKLDARNKILLAVLPYLVVGYLLFAQVGSAFMQGRDLETEVNSQRKEENELKLKLADIGRLRQEKSNMEKEIEDLRTAVPGSADLDLLMIDMEKICLQSGMDILSMGGSDKGRSKDAERQKSEVSAAAALLKAKQPALNIASSKQLAGKDGGKPGGKSGEKPASPTVPPTPEELGLSRLDKELVITGTYPNFVEFMRRMEAYQRVVSIDKVEFRLPDAKDTRKKGVTENPTISFLMTAYFLP